MRDARGEAERHMLRVWWIRVVAMATGWDEDVVAVHANNLERVEQAKRDLVASQAWKEWLPYEYRVGL